MTRLSSVTVEVQGVANLRTSCPAKTICLDTDEPSTACLIDTQTALMMWLPALLKQKQAAATAIETSPSQERHSRETNFKLSSRINVQCTEHGLVLESGRHIARIQWGLQGTVERLNIMPADDSLPSCSALGVVGLLRGFSNSYLLLISDKRLAATLPGDKSIYGLSRVWAIPLSSHEASAAITKHLDHRVSSSSSSSSSSDSEDVVDVETPSIEKDPPLADAPATNLLSSKPRKQSFSMGALFWPKPTMSQQPLPALQPISRTASPSKVASAIISENEEPEKAIDHLRHASDPASHSHTEPEPHPHVARETISRQNLDHKILREAIRELESGGMWFATDFDATHDTQTKAKRLQEVETAKQESKKGEVTEDKINVLQEPDRAQALWKRADERFFWNRWLSKPFTDQGLDAFVYPIFQGYVQHAKINWTPIPSTAAAVDRSRAPEQSLDLYIISRRSIERPGLRYQRRGVNADGGAANFVATEFILSSDRVGIPHVASFVQTRGSIPLFWSQSPWNLKPIPVLERSSEDNAAAISKHFATQLAHYGNQTVVNLAEQHGKEAVVVKAYEDAVKNMQNENVKYIGFDFHQECKGMRYENVSKLTSQLEGDMKEYDFFWCTPQQILSSQSGTVRTNCMDCLDRTNVVQSAIARSFLNTTLERFGIELLTNPATSEKLDSVCNDLWASNGDAISREYAGTSALKGDFTRTGKRNWRGVVNDASNSIARLWQNTIGDFFKQSMLDFVLGINLYSFADFQDKLSATDPGELHRLASIRSTAIETCSQQLLTEGEHRLAGWTLLSPTSDSQEEEIQTHGFEEKVLLLSEKALYIVSYEYSLQKVREFARIPLLCISSISYGTFILSTLSSFARDPVENYGFVLHYNLLPGEGEAVEEKSNTYSVRTTKDPDSPMPATTAGRAVFKAMRRDMVIEASSREKERTGEATVKAVLDQIQKQVSSLGGEVEHIEQDVRSLDTALRSESLFGKILHSIEHYIWL